MRRLNKLKVTSSNYRTLLKLETIGECHDEYLRNTRKTISEELQTLTIKKREVMNAHDEMVSATREDSAQLASNYLQANAELKELQMSCHPGFIIPFDNFDLRLARRDMTMSQQNMDVHWTNHSMVENRVSGNHLSSERTKDILDVPNIQFLPSVDDQRRQRVNYIILVSRILVDHFDAFNVFKGVCIRHIPHKYNKELSAKSNKVKNNCIFLLF